MESGRMNLMHLPPGAISWLWDRPTKQIDAAESLAVAANAHGNPVVDASLLKADQNVLLIKCQGGETFRIYPDGGFSHNDSPMDIGGCSSVLQGMGQSECEMDDNGHQMDAGGAMPMNMPMNMPMDMPMGMDVAMVMGESDEFKPYELVTYQSDGEVWNTGYDDAKTAILHGRNQMKGGDTMGFQVVTPSKNFLSDPEVQHQEGDIAEDAGNDEHMDAEAPESGVASPTPLTNLAGEPTMDEADGAGGGFSMGSGSGAPYVGDISMSADPEMDNLVSSRELGEASIHMFRNESDEGLEALSAALGLNEYNYPDMDDYDPSDGYDPSDDMADVENINLEVYDESTDSYQEFPVTVKWNVEPTEYEGQYLFYQGSADVESINLAKPIRVNGKVYRQMDDELAALILQTYNTKETSLSDYIADQYAHKIDIPQHKYPDSSRN